MLQGCFMLMPDAVMRRFYAQILDVLSDPMKSSQKISNSSDVFFIWGVQAKLRTKMIEFLKGLFRGLKMAP